MQLTIKGFIYAQKEAWHTKPEFTFFDFENCNNWVKVMPHEFTVEIPDDFDIREGLVANLEREKQKVTADFHKRVTEINAEIQSLLAIENSATVIDADDEMIPF